MSNKLSESQQSSFYRRMISLGIPASSVDLNHEAMNDLYETRLEANRFGCLVAFIVVFSGFLIDFYYHSDQAISFAAIRAPALILIAFLWYIQGSWNSYRGRILPVTGFALASAISWIVTLMIWNVGGAESPYFGGFMLVMMGMAFVTRVSPAESVVYGLYMLAQYVFGVWAHANNFLGFATDAPLTPPGSLYEIVQNGTLFGVGIFFVVVGGVLCTVGAVLISSESYARLIEKAKARGAREDLMRFVTMASHEIKTPVQYLVTCAEHLTTLGEMNGNSEFSEIRNGIGHQTKRLLNELSKLAEVSRIADDQTSIVSIDPTSRASIGNALDRVLDDARAASKVGGVKLTVDGGVNGAQAVGGVDDLFLIFNNVVNNAVKYTPKGGLIAIKSRVVNNRLVEVTVTDNGPGMNESQLAVLFEPFRQGDAQAVSRHFSGMGLGMFLSRQRLGEMGGKIGVESTPGVGTEITISIPVAEWSLPQSARVVAPTARMAGAGSVVGAAVERTALEHYSYERSRLRIEEANEAGLVLIVDDEASIHESIGMILKGWRRVHAINASEALRAVREMRPQVVIMDVMLPGMDGITAVRKIRESQVAGAMQIIVTSALLDYEAKPLLKAAIDGGANDVINKPFSLVELEQRVRAHMRVSQLQATLQDAYQELKVTQGRLLQSEKLRTISILTDGLLHNIGNPLNSALSTFSTLKDKCAGESRLDKHWDNGLSSLRLIAQQIKELKKYTHPDGGQVRERVNVEQLFDRALDVAGIDEQLIQVSRSFGVGALSANALYITQILVAFLLNAKDALKGSPEPALNIGSRRVLVDGTYRTDVFVSDNGAGVDLDAPIFDAYYTGKDIGEGSGLGLYVASIMAEDMGGLLLAEKNESMGSLFAIRFEETDPV